MSENSSKSRSRGKSSDVTAAQVAEDLRKVIAEAQELLKDTAQTTFEENADRVSRSIHSGVDQLKSAYSTGQDQAEALVAETRLRINEHPLRSVAIAAGAGLLLGAFLNRKD